ncbi:uncharacterized protein LOC121259209 [Juglans microcarpa x Juglans regia]|uniref:uncharacterized protein LOC121259209 n=1 Tax=Juglans microcarpa x Juglans regia TaxID=2249226 RepID=UPI001B7EF5B8|nr:uncharacterized protein LOC121259209 [Juglans microcarpa x Juglans regia]
MHRPQRESFVIQLLSGREALPDQASTVPPKFNFSDQMKLFNSFRKILMRLLFSLPSRGSSAASGMAARQKNCDTNVSHEPPKTSCSSYYSSHSHYNEAIADCIEFFNKSSQDGILDSRKSDVQV